MNGGGIDSPATTPFLELVKVTITLAGNMGTNPFFIFDQETDEVIMLINYYLALGENGEHNDNYINPTSYAPQREKRIRVNDKTATGGWF